MLRMRNSHYWQAACNQSARCIASTPYSAARCSNRLYGAGSHVSDDDPLVLEREKKRNLAGKTVDSIKDAPGWNINLASDSEADIKADRSADKTVSEMQAETIEFVGKEDEMEKDC